jgi:7-cyano-7-deazaguanine synthase in queuosine biosynthesis
MRKVLLSSGGMDSFLLAHEPELMGAEHVFVNVGQVYAGKEARAAQYVADSVHAQIHYVTTADLCKFEHKPTGIIPFRNAELILCAAQYGEEIYLGVIADEVNSDKSPEFLMAMRSVLNISHRGQYWTEGREFHLLTPFRNITKTQMVSRYIANGGSMEHLLHSVSCYSGSAMHCGRCSSCFKRWVALTGATGVDYGSEFNEHPATWHPRGHWQAKLEGYAQSRQRETFDALDIAGV